MYTLFRYLWKKSLSLSHVMHKLYIYFYFKKYIRVSKLFYYLWRKSIKLSNKVNIVHVYFYFKKFPIS